MSDAKYSVSLKLVMMITANDAVDDSIHLGPISTRQLNLVCTQSATNLYALKAQSIVKTGRAV